jgi:hypothetical protein
MVKRNSTLRDSAYRTCACAGTAVDASISIDNILGITGRDSANRAAALAGTTHYAGIADYICHFQVPPYENKYNCLINAKTFYNEASRLFKHNC